MTKFNINGKVAIVTGGASGIGRQYVFELLRKEAKGVTIADVDSEAASKVLREIESEFGKNKAIFVETNIANYDQFEEAFKITVSKFKNVAILINNAGVFNDAAWPKEIDVNVKGTIHGMLLGLDNYIPMYKSGSEGVIVNTSSLAGVTAYACAPIYVATKFAIHGLTLSWGHCDHYNRTKVRVVGICPGLTTTPLAASIEGTSLGSVYEEFVVKDIANSLPQSTEQMGPHLTKVIEKAPCGTMWIIEAGEVPYQFQLPDRFTVPKVYL